MAVRPRRTVVKGALPAPMLATAGKLPRPDEDDDWAFEMKWDGMRVVAEARTDGWRLMGRSGRDVTGSFPDLAGPPGLADLADHLGGRPVVLDGEVVAMEPDGRPSFGLLQQRMNVARPAPALVAAVPVSYLVFDLLRLDGHDPTGLPWEERRRLLEALDLDEGPDGRVRVPPVILGDGATSWEAARSMRLEGVVAKRLDSPYVEGARSSAWRKVKLLRTQEVVLVGWAEGEGRRAGGIGALLLAVPDAANGPLVSAGRVGTGFTDRMLDDLAARLQPLERDDPPVVDPPRGAAARGVHWVEPELVGEVAFSEWTTARTLRQPSWRGLRPDKSPDEVVVEA